MKNETLLTLMSIVEYRESHYVAVLDMYVGHLRY